MTWESWQQPERAEEVKRVWLKSLEHPQAVLAELLNFVRVGIEQERAAVGDAREYQAPER